MQDLPWSGFSLHGVSLIGSVAARKFIPRRAEKTNHRDTEAQRVPRESEGTSTLVGALSMEAVRSRRPTENAGLRYNSCLSFPTSFLPAFRLPRLNA